MPLSLAARYGLHRVLEGDGMFPQPTWKLDADPRISDAERGKLHNPATGSGGMPVGLPDDIPERIAPAALDVAGAPSRTAALARPGDTVNHAA